MRHKLEDSFSGSGQTAEFEVKNFKQWITVELVDAGSSDGVYAPQFYDDEGAAWVTPGDYQELSVAGTQSREYHLPPGRYRFDTSTDESGAADIYVGGDALTV